MLFKYLDEGDKMTKTCSLDHLDTGATIFFNWFYTINDPDEPIYLPIYPTCEKSVFIEQAKKNLSEETREVLEMLLNCPTEIIEDITTGTGNLSLNALKQYLKQCCLSRKTITRVFKELKQFKCEMEEI